MPILNVKVSRPTSATETAAQTELTRQIADLLL